MLREGDCVGVKISRRLPVQAHMEGNITKDYQCTHGQSIKSRQNNQCTHGQSIKSRQNNQCVHGQRIKSRQNNQCMHGQRIKLHQSFPEYLPIYFSCLKFLNIC